MKKIVKQLLSIALCTMLIMTGACAVNQVSKEGAMPDSSAATTSVTSLTEVDPSYSNRDIAGTYDTTDATYIKLDSTSAAVSGSGASVSGSVVTISDEGVYIISGTLKDGQIIVNAEDTDKVQLVLNNASVTCSNNPAIYVQQADKVFITLPSGTTNTLADGTSYNLADGEDEPDATIFSHDDLTINGTGTLNVKGNYSSGIRGKDDVVVAGATLNITAIQHGIKGKDSVGIYSGNITITAGQDGINSSNDTDEDKGWVSIDGGTLTICAGDDGIHAEKQLQILGGTVTVTKSYEGLEGLTVLIAGGTTDVTASDDGINAAGGSDSASTDTDFGRRGGGGDFEANAAAFIQITGGTVSINAGGDGIDSNGSLNISGGTIIVNGPTNSGNGSFDYAGTAVITGGTLAAAGSSGMAQGFASTSTQNSLMVTFASNQSASVPVTLKDSSGNAIFTFIPSKQYQTIQFSSSSLTTGSTYTLYSGGTVSGTGTSGLYMGKSASGSTKVTDFTLSSVSTSVSDTGEAVSGGMGMGGNHGMGMGGGKPGMAADGSIPTMPDGTTPGAFGGGFGGSFSGGDFGPQGQGGQGMYKPTTQQSKIILLVNGKFVSLDAYNIDGYNFFKLRDLAYVINGTKKQFSVSWDETSNTVTLTSGESYTKVGGELEIGADNSSTTQMSRSMISADGNMARLTAYNIGDNNYFKLRDVCSLFDIGVTWENSTSTIGIDTETSYTAE